jgi:hypothetical protein
MGRRIKRICPKIPQMIGLQPGRRRGLPEPDKLPRLYLQSGVLLLESLDLLREIVGVRLGFHEGVPLLLVLVNQSCQGKEQNKNQQFLHWGNFIPWKPGARLDFAPAGGRDPSDMPD